MIAHPTVLTIAGSDSSGGAGMQADLKTIAANNCYGASVITSITSQNTLGVHDIYDLPTSVIERQFKAVVEDLDVKIVKLGMLNSKEIITVVDNLLKKSKIPFILDPVMSSKDSTSLLKSDALDALKLLSKKAFLLTPNIPEAEILVGFEIKTVEDMKAACLEIDAPNVLLKGGHLEGNILVDILYHDKQFYEYKHRKIITQNTHGTGCTLASAIASHVALEDELPTACEEAIEYVKKAIIDNYPTGQGAGSLNHFFMNGNKNG